MNIKSDKDMSFSKTLSKKINLLLSCQLDHIVGTKTKTKRDHIVAEKPNSTSF